MPRKAMRDAIHEQRMAVHAEVEDCFNEDGHMHRHEEEQRMLHELHESLAKAHYHAVRAVNLDAEIERWRARGKHPHVAAERAKHVEKAKK